MTTFPRVASVRANLFHTIHMDSLYAQTLLGAICCGSVAQHHDILRCCSGSAADFRFVLQLGVQQIRNESKWVEFGTQAARMCGSGIKSELRTTSAVSDNEK